MDKQKIKSPFGYISVLALLLCMAALVISVGTTFSRYSKEISGSMTFGIRESEHIIIGTVTNGNFSPAEEIVWTEENGEAVLKVAVANGTSSKDFCKSNQRITLEIVGSLGLSIDPEDPSIKLVLPSTEEDGEPVLVFAKATPIEKGTALYKANGEGWVLNFFDEEGKEVFWELKGGKLSFEEITIKAETSKISATSMLVPQIKAEIVTE